MNPANSTGLPAVLRPFVSWRGVVLGILWLILGIYYLTPVWRVLEPDLDSSIHATYAHFTAHGYQFGSQVNTTAGPYGFVMFGWDYSGELFWTQLALQVFFTLGLSALILWFLCAAPRSTGWHWAWLAAMLLELNVGDTLFTFTILLSGLFLILNYSRPDRLAASVAAAVFLAFLSLIKGTQLAETFGGLFCVALMALLTRSWRRAGWIAGGYLLGLTGWWLAAGQNPLHLPAYVEAISHIAQGYNEAMALVTPVRLLVIGAAMTTGLLTLLAWTAVHRRANPAMLASCVLLAGVTYVSWKHGYVRSDGHMYIFVDFACVAAFTVPMLEHILGLRSRHLLARGITLFFPLAVAAFSIAGSQELYPGRMIDLIRNVGPQWAHNFHALLTADDLKDQSDTALGLRRATYDLPRVREAVGSASIDFFGHEIGLLLLNGFNYQPTPVCCGTYGVYNRFVKELNNRHFADPATRPDFILLKLQTIDHRFVAIDDSLSLLTILNLYQPVLLEDDALLLKVRPGATKPVPPHLLSTQGIRLGEDVTVPEVGPDQMLLFSFSLPSSLAGNALAFLYKPPLLFMDLQGDGLTQTLDQRIIASSVGVPSLLNPTLEGTPDVLALLAGQPGKKVRRLRLHTSSPGCFLADRFTVSFYTVPRPAVAVTGKLPIYYSHSVFRDPPDYIDPPRDVTPMYRGERVQYLPSPSRAVFTLNGTERQLNLIIGIDEDAYLRGRTDGVSFSVELEPPGQPPQLLARRSLHPRYVPTDRGKQLLLAPLPPTYQPGSRIVVRTDPVPGGGTAWGWSFVSRLQFVRGNFLHSQFPGFTTLPVAVESVGCGLTTVQDRDALLLNAPSSLLFNLPPSAKEVSFTGGLLEGSYSHGGRTDGVEFIAECLRPDGSVETVFRRWLQPLTVPADRGDQVMHAPLPARPAGSRLRLRVTVGPNGNNAWDWAYMTAFGFR